MKKIFNIVSIISAALLVFACAPKESYKPGAPEDPNCMGVFFPAQELKSAFAPEETFQVDVKVSRAKASGDVIVPAKVYGNEDEYFFVSPIEFLDGQTETTCSIFFSKDMPLGKEYKLTVAIEDPAYASKYNKNASFINVPVVIENYKYLGDAEFFEEFEFTDMDGELHSFMVPLYQNVMNPSEFRLLDPYKEGNEKFGYTSLHPAVSKFNFKILEPGTVLNKDTDNELTIKGEDYVYFTDFYTGDNVPSEGCDVIAFSPFDHYGELNGTDAALEDSRVQNYQDPDAEGNVLPAVVQISPCYLLDDGSFRGWGFYPIVIRFPGGAFVDYTFGISTAECKDGQSPITFSLGKDVKAVKYLVYPGELTAKEIRQESALIGAGEKAAESLDITLPRIFVTCEETGLYTIVAVGFDKNGNQQASASTVFGYVKPGDEEDVAIVFDANLETTPARYEKDGYSTMNSLLFYMVGDDVTSVRYKLLETEDFEENPDSVVEAVTSKGTLLSDDQLYQVNQPGGYCNLFTKLSPLTSYTLVAYAFNGYTGKTVVRTLSTEGLPLEQIGTGTYAYCGWFCNEDGSPYFEEGLELWIDPNTNKDYEIRHWGYDVTFKFSEENGKVTLEPGFTGDSYGKEDVMFMETKDYIDLTAATYGVPVELVLSVYEVDPEVYNTTSSFDKEKGLYTFSLAYFNDTYFFCAALEYFAIDEDAPAEIVTSAIKSSVKKNVVKSFGKVDLPTFRPISVEREINAASVEVKASEAAPAVRARDAKPAKISKR